MNGDIIDYLHYLRQEANQSFLAVVKTKKEPTGENFDEAWRLTLNVRNGLDGIADLIEDRAFPRTSIVKRLSFLLRGR